MATKLIVITGFLVSFAAGMMVGVRERIVEPTKPVVAVGPTTGPTTGPFAGRNNGGPRRPPPQSIIVRELALTPDQTKLMNQIFSKVADVGHQLDDQRRNLRQKRDDEIRDIAKQEQNDRYDKILKDYTEASDKITDEWRNIYTSAVEQTKLILNDDQRKHYEEILTRNRWDGRGEGWPWPWGDRGGRGGPPGGRGPREGGRLNPQNQSSGSDNNNNSRPGMGSATTKPQ